MSYKKVASNIGYDKHMEHLDQSPLGKLQQQYWTTKQQVIKKLGKKEDEYVVMSDAELDAKLDLFEAIDQNSADLLRIIEMYQEKLIILSIEESEMSRFLKSHSTYDTKTKAGKMMAAVAKAQNFAAQQRTSLRLPLVRLFNEVETFRNRAIADTFLTVRKMEIARTEYRGALLWMKNVSTELDPDTGKKLEKFRRVQAQVKKTKTKFDRLKIDVIQKIELLAASRCNMFSNVLVGYSKILLLFWEKTARTMNVVAEAFKGYQYYEFNIIKDLVEPSKKLAELVNNSGLNDKTISLKDNNDNSISNLTDEQLLNLNEDEKLKENTLIDLEEEEKINEGINEVNKLIDLMTLNEATTLNEQLKELEQIEIEKKNRLINKSPSQTSSSTFSNNINESNLKKSPGSNLASALFGLGSMGSAKSTSNNANSNLSSNPINSLNDSLGMSGTSFNLNSFADILSNASNEFEREWESVFSTNNSANDKTEQTNEQTNNTPLLSPSSATNKNEFNFFASTNNDFTSNFTDLLKNTNTDLNLDLNMIKRTETASNSSVASSSLPTKSESGNTNKNSTWFDLFAELDPIKNPDTLGKESDKDERNC